MGTFQYFAYGSNMLTTRLRGRCPSAEAVAVGAVRGRVLRWHKVSSDGSGKCDLAVSDTNDIAHGVVFRIDAHERAQLDEAEGLGNGYDAQDVAVVTARERVSCLTYIATRIREGLRPYDWYRDLVLAGALEHGLPESYVQSIASIGAMADPLPNRRTRREAMSALDDFARQYPKFKTRLTGARDDQALA